MYKRILVPTDGSQLSAKAIAGAVELAGAVGAEVIGLGVVPRYPVSFFEGSIAMPLDEVARIEKEYAERGLAHATAVVSAAEAAGVKARAVTARSDLVAEAILAAARKHRCDLIVMASHGRKGVKRLLLGSETLHVLTHGTVPVLVLR